jgi:UDP-N-acetylglucosamine 2-epimerase (non-hydrolysing)
MIHVFIGTKAQYIKSAPVLRRMDERGVPYRLIDSGQHARLSADLRRELGIRPPDMLLGGAENVASIPQAITWAIRVAGRLVASNRLLHEVFGGQPGVVLVHGDTPSTLLSTLLARRAGLPVAHLEAGLRSGHLFHPFPEEMIRVMVMRWSDVLFAPDDAAIANLEAMRLRGRMVRLSGNTSLEALRHALGGEPPEPGSGPAIVTTHRVENLHRRDRVESLVQLIARIAAERPVRFVVHEPTAAVLWDRDLYDMLFAAGVELMPLQSHAEFARLLAAAPFVITEGGSVQEECALIGVPTLLWRAHTERPDGLGVNVVISGYQTEVVEAFLADPERLRHPSVTTRARPSDEIIDTLVDDPLLAQIGPSGSTL